MKEDICSKPAVSLVMFYLINLLQNKKVRYTH